MRTEAKPQAAPSIDVRKLKQVRVREMAVRFALGAVVSVVAALVAKTVGARFGGAFLAFPAILPASLTFVQDKEGTRMADRAALGAILGGLGLVAFVAVAESMLTRHESAGVLALALAAWLAVSALLYAALVAVRPGPGGRRRD